jgi:hypothetical protein
MIRVKQTSGHRVSMPSAQGWRERPAEERYETHAGPHLANMGFCARTAEGVLVRREDTNPTVTYRKHRVVKGRTLTHEDEYGKKVPA